MVVKRAYHHGDLRRALVLAAREALVERGPEGVSLRGTVAKVGASTAAPYRHFRDKDALLVAVALEGHAELQGCLRACGAGTVTALGHSYLGFAVENPALYRLMSGAGIGDRAAYPELAEAHRVTCAVLAERVGERNDPGGFPVTLWCLLHGLATLVIDGHVESGSAVAEAERSLAFLADARG
ncbi:TetR/AcrR family transcriptional regulator [Amycolatopsis regifaucium]|uniref:TetR family transcriptional regulator n=1 Tax=Amycolatopsis regifaucium TaxID=546365 RepID=A0A154M4V2_9PSEU|nr:TetR/AcrR family transcriptional regulator [Amycolatopsis regifaucium]KZB79397.1 TetR family transcriptional regulator [Amycolatopsis regifaucium]OKA07578.1 TetR family transcriptional regulator [Amycolatopsis regifaucium]SFH07868.1 DNA-binding transcriptional regulator, AcrR family [Amycolatopsis regifaucium]